MKVFRSPPRVLVSGAITLTLCATVFVGVQVVDVLRANATPVRPAVAVRRFPPVAIPRRPLAARRALMRKPIRKPIRKAIRRPVASRRARVAIQPVSAVSPPTTCAGVVGSIAWPRGWRVQCNGPREGLLGATQPGGITDLFVRTDEPMSKLRVVALHEAGHAWDFARLDPPRIARWCAARGCDAEHFFDGAVSSEGWAEPSGAEDWASAWDACHGGEYHRSYMGFAPPTPPQCSLQNALVGYPR
jgi:hypothetical protein